VRGSGFCGNRFRLQRPLAIGAMNFPEASMNNQLQELLAELEQFGTTNDSATTERSRKMLNITRDTGELLAVLVRATVARRVLEIGTSNGYSTLWLASAAQAIGGSVTTVEFSDYKIALATKTFARSELASFITSIQDDAGRVLERTADSAFDFIFLDSERPEYPGWWANLRRVLRPGGLLVVDNAASHPQEMAPFVALVQADPIFTTSLVPVGNGEFMAVKAGM
jgi:predicted O-methyltransferase YrrM